MKKIFILFLSGVMIIGGGWFISRDIDSLNCEYNKSEIINEDGQSQTNKYFITTWDPNRFNGVKIKINPKFKDQYNYKIDCESDGKWDATGVKEDYLCVYGKDHPVKISIGGDFPGIYEAGSQLLEVNQWGKIKWKTMRRAFYFSYRLKKVGTDIPDLSEVRSMEEMFFLASTFSQNLSKWDVSKVQNMKNMFYGAKKFHGDISSWDVSQVIDMRQMFREDFAFNKDISNWNVSKVRDMSSMFYKALTFNQDLSRWDVSNVIDMNGMFGDSRFNGDISKWNLKRVKNISGMFFRNRAFNRDISKWNVSSVANMERMFVGAKSFNQNLSKWNVGKVTNMYGMFSGAEKFNQDLSKWDVENVTRCLSFSKNSALKNTHLPNFKKGCEKR